MPPRSTILALAALAAGGLLAPVAGVGEDPSPPGLPDAASGVTPDGLSPSAADCTPPAGWGTPDRTFAARVVAVVNAHRAARGLTALATTQALTRSGEWKALHMAAHRYLEHDDPAPPVARDPWTRMADCGHVVRATLAENIAMGSAIADAEQLVGLWLASPGHRANIENPAMRAIGVGVARTPGGTLYAAQQFSGSARDGTEPPAAPEPPPPPSVAPAPPAEGIASDDAAQTVGRRPVRVPVLANDRGAGLRITWVRALEGRARIDGDAVVVLPERGPVHDQRVRYGVAAADGSTGEATVTVRVTPPPLVAVTDRAAAGGVVRPLANDAGEGLRFGGWCRPSRRVAVSAAAPGRWRLAWTGPGRAERLCYRVSDAWGRSARGAVVVYRIAR